MHVCVSVCLCVCVHVHARYIGFKKVSLLQASTRWSRKVSLGTYVAFQSNDTWSSPNCAIHTNIYRQSLRLVYGQHFLILNYTFILVGLKIQPQHIRTTFSRTLTAQELPRGGALGNPERRIKGLGPRYAHDQLVTSQATRRWWIQKGHSYPLAPLLSAGFLCSGRACIPEDI